MMTDNRTRDVLLYGAWALIAVIGGILFQAEAALIGLIATLPLSVLGLSDLMMSRPAKTASPPVEPLSFAPPPNVEPPEARPVVPPTVTPPRGIPVYPVNQVAPEAFMRDLNRVSSGLQAVVIQQSGSLGEQNQLLKSIERTMGELNSFIGQARREAVRLSASGGQTRTALQSGREAIGGTLDGLSATTGQVEQTVVALTELAKHVRRTGQIIAAVNEIATQSNFLALNAAIEAARADNVDTVSASSGRAFATVADEVRALSEQSKATVAQLHTALLDAQHALEHATDVIQNGSQHVERSTAAARQLETVFGKLAEAIDETESAGQRIIVVVDRQSGGLESLAETFNESGKFAEQARVGLQLIESAARDLERLIQERQPELAAQV